MLKPARSRPVRNPWGRLSAGSRGVLAIAGSTAAVQGVALLAAPVLARLYSPSDFGLFAVVTALSLIIGAVAGLRLEQAIPLPTEGRTAYGLAAGGMASAATVAAVGVVAATVAGAPVAVLLHLPGSRWWLLCPPIVGGLVAVYAIFNQLAIRRRDYATVGRRNVAQGVATLATQLGAGAAGLRPGGLVAGLGMGHVVGVVTLARSAQLGSDEARAGRRPAQVRAAASRYRRFPLLLAPAGLLNVAGQHAPVMLVSALFGGHVAGWLGLTLRVLALPLALVGTATAQVFLGQLAHVARTGDGDARRLFLAATRRLLAVGAALAVVLGVAGPWLFTAIFGGRWSESGIYAQSLAVALAAQFVASPLSQTLIVFERLRLQFVWDAGRLVAVSTAIVVAAQVSESPVTALRAFAVASTVAYVVSWWLSYRTVRRGS